MCTGITVAGAGGLRIIPVAWPRRGASCRCWPDCQLLVNGGGRVWAMATGACMLYRTAGGGIGMGAVLAGLGGGCCGGPGRATAEVMVTGAVDGRWRAGSGG